MDTASRTTSLPDRRVVLLGASNIARSLSIVVDCVRNVWGSPLDIVAATGHGRSYGMTSRVLGRSLPGILQSGLWEALASRTEVPTASLITDIGNDLLCGASADQITGWVERCLSQLRPVSEQLTITALPLSSLEQVGAARFLTMRTILFPKSRLTLGHALKSAQELNANVTQLAERYDAQIITPARHWYGLDPIHIKRVHQTDAWRQILCAWTPDREVTAARYSLMSAARLLRVRPQSRCLFGIHQRCEQPVLRFPDGSLLSLY